MPTEVFNPLSACTLGGELKSSMPDHPGRFAPLIGMLLDDAAGEANTIDFLNPRKKAEPKTHRRELTIAAAAAAVLLLAGAGWIGLQLHNLDSQIAELDSDLAQLKPKVDKAILSKANAEKIQTWLDGDPNWLDEIANLSTKAPGGKEFWVIKLNTPKANDGTASMQVLADVKSSDVGERFTNVMRNERHVVRPKTSDEENKVAEYPVNIETEIQISPPKPAAAPKKDSAPAGATAAKQTAPDASDTAKTTTPEAPAK